MKIACPLLSCLMILQYSTAKAQPVELQDESNLKINLGYSQQEIGLLGADILGPNLGAWGRLGFNLASGSYRADDPQGKWEQLSVNQYALVWRSEESLLSLDHSVFHRTLGMAANLRFGSMNYESMTGAGIEDAKFNFLEFDQVFYVGDQSKDADSKRWAKFWSFGVGAGVRVNFIKDVTLIGTSQVDEMRVYPTLQFSSSFF